jgi:septal ring factor EnvC (AmiA/AmiB activator)
MPARDGLPVATQQHPLPRSTGIDRPRTPAARHARRFLGPFALALGLLTGCSAYAAAAPQPARNANPEELRQLRERIDRLKSAIAGAEETRNEARDALRESERAISEANRQLHELARDRQSARHELERLNAETRQIEAELAQRQAAIGRLLVVHYEHGETDYLKLLMSGADPNQAARELHYYGYISRAQADLMKALRASLAQMRALQDQTREKTEEIARIESEQKSERNRLSREQSARKGVLDKVSARLREQRRQVQGLERDESRLTRLIQEIGKVIAEQAQKSRNERKDNARAPRSTPAPNAPANEALPETGSRAPFASLRGSLRLPVRGQLVSRFGSSRPEGGPSWKGLFIRAAPGQEVHAVAPGQVVFAEWMRGFGNLLILDHGSGYLTVYGNNESVLKQVGDNVRTGDTIATTGASGGSTESGLYFEARHEGQPFDPLKWVSRK